MLLLFSMIYIKRIHDLNKSPLLLLLLPIPIIGLIVGLKLAFFKGTKGVNRYGFDPIK